MSAYLFFTKEVFPVIRKRFGGKVTVSQISHVVSAQWAAATPEQKAPYEALAAVERERYSREKAEYEATLPPKRALSPYSFFVKEQRPLILAANPGMSFADVGRELGRQWNEMTPGHPLRRRCEEHAIADRMRYVREKTAFDRGGNAQ